MNKIKAAITAVASHVPDYVLSNAELEKMVDTTDDWITTRTGIKERRILKGEGKGVTEMAKVAMRRDDSLSGNPAAPEGARVTITTKDGRAFSGLLAEPTGMPGNPMSDAQLEKKFLYCCTFGGAPDGWAGALLAKLWDIEQLPALRALFRLPPV